MSAGVFVAVLAAALLHAGWNAALKVKLEPLIAMTLITGCAGIIGLPFFVAFGMPKAESLPWLAASTFLHLAYYLTLTEAYRRAEMGQVYPIARGGAPLLTAIGSAIVLREWVSPLAAAGIATLCCGVMTMSLAGRGASGRAAPPDRRGIGFALLTSLTICGYTIADGTGARLSGDPHAYAAALFVFDALPLPLTLLALRGRDAFRPMRRYLLLGFGGGAMTLAAYWIAIWAFTVAPIALVATLRETSVLFAMLIAVFVLKEEWRPVRGVAAILIVAGIATMRLA